jgi:hypothetical protein
LTSGVGGFVVLPLRMPLRSFSEEEAEQEIRERERGGRSEVSSPRENQIARSMPRAGWPSELTDGATRQPPSGELATSARDPVPEKAGFEA